MTKEYHSIRQFDGRLYHHTEMGECSDFVVQVQSRKAYDSLFSLRDIEELTIFHPETGEILYHNDPRSTNLLAMMRTNYMGHIPDNVNVDDYRKWVLYNYPCRIKGNMLSWQESAK